MAVLIPTFYGVVEPCHARDKETQNHAASHRAGVVGQPRRSVGRRRFRRRRIREAVRLLRRRPAGHGLVGRPCRPAAHLGNLGDRSASGPGVGRVASCCGRRGAGTDRPDPLHRSVQGGRWRHREVASRGSRHSGLRRAPNGDLRDLRGAQGCGRGPGCRLHPATGPRRPGEVRDRVVHHGRAALRGGRRGERLLRPVGLQADQLLSRAGAARRRAGPPACGAGAQRSRIQRADAEQ